VLVGVVSRTDVLLAQTDHLAHERHERHEGRDRQAPVKRGALRSD
jgi:hypothetical protein